jgi:hypothetical protein
MTDKAEADLKRWGNRGDIPIPTPAQRNAEGRRNWFTRMGMMGFVPHPDRKHGRIALICAALPRLFPTAASFSTCEWVHRERWDLLEEHWPEHRTTMAVHLPGMKLASWALVAARTPEDASKILLQHLPSGTHVVPRS